jgi:hypothetical protein
METLDAKVPDYVVGNKGYRLFLWCASSLHKINYYIMLNKRRIAKTLRETSAFIYFFISLRELIF